MSSLRTLSYSLLTCPGQFKRTAIRLSKVYESSAYILQNELLSVQTSRSEWAVFLADWDTPFKNLRDFNRYNNHKFSQTSVLVPVHM